jgi:hypothetical protein
MTLVSKDVSSLEQESRDGAMAETLVPRSRRHGIQRGPHLYVLTSPQPLHG